MTFLTPQQTVMESLTVIALAVLTWMVWGPNHGEASASVNASSDACQVYLSPQYSLYAGQPLHKGQVLRQLGQTSPLAGIPMQLSNHNFQVVSWRTFAWSPSFMGYNNTNTVKDKDYDGVLIPGLGMYMECRDPEDQDEEDDKIVNVAMHVNPHQHTVSFVVAADEIPVGAKLITACPFGTLMGEDHHILNDGFDSEAARNERKEADATWHQPHDGICMDGTGGGKLAYVDTTTFGSSSAVTKHAIQPNEVILQSPVLHLHRQDVAVFAQHEYNNDKDNGDDDLVPWVRPRHRDGKRIVYTHKVVANQTDLLSRCIAHADSDLLLWPVIIDLATVIQPATEEHTANVGVRWVEDDDDDDEVYSLLEFFLKEDTLLVLEVYALTYLSPGETLYMNMERHSPDGEGPMRMDHMYPDSFMRLCEADYGNGDFIANPLSPNVLAPVRWLDTADVVTPWGFRLGLDPHVGDVLREYAQRMGITDILRQATVEGNPLESSTDYKITNIKGGPAAAEWYLQRPDKIRRTNMHWLCPGNAEAHEDLLQALQIGGFDDALAGIGETLGLQGLCAYQLSFIGTSYSAKVCTWLRLFLRFDILSLQLITFFHIQNKTGMDALRRNKYWQQGL